MRLSSRKPRNGVATLSTYFASSETCLLYCITPYLSNVSFCFLIPGVQYASNKQKDLPALIQAPEQIDPSVEGLRYLPCPIPKQEKFFINVTYVDPQGCLYGVFAGTQGQYLYLLLEIVVLFILKVEGTWQLYVFRMLNSNYSSWL